MYTQYIFVCVLKVKRFKESENKIMITKNLNPQTFTAYVEVLLIMHVQETFLYSML